MRQKEQINIEDNIRWTNLQTFGRNFLTFSMHPDITTITTYLIRRVSSNNNHMEHWNNHVEKNYTLNYCTKLTQLPPSEWCHVFLHTPQNCFDFRNCYKIHGSITQENVVPFHLEKRKQDTSKTKHFSHTLAQCLHKSWVSPVELFIFFELLHGRTQPQPSQGCASPLLNTPCKENHRN